MGGSRLVLQLVQDLANDWGVGVVQSGGESGLVAFAGP